MLNPCHVVAIATIFSCTKSLEYSETFPTLGTENDPTESDVEVPKHYYDIGKTLITLSVEDAYGDSAEVIRKLGPRNQSYLKSEEWEIRANRTHPTLSFESELFKTWENETKEESVKSESNQGIRENDRSYLEANAPRMPLISIWPGWTPFPFHFPTPWELRMTFTDNSEWVNHKHNTLWDIDSDPDEPLRWDHLIHTPKLVVLDFDYTTTNFSTDLIWEPLFPFKFGTCLDKQGHLFAPGGEVRKILTELRKRNVITVQMGRERRPELVFEFLNLTSLLPLFDHVIIYKDSDLDDMEDYLKRLSKLTNISCRDMLLLDENHQNLKDAYTLGATPQRVYNGLTMRAVNRCLDQHNQFHIHGRLPKHMFWATGIPGIDKEDFEDPSKNFLYMTTMSPEEYKKEYDKHIEKINKKLKPGQPPYPRYTKWVH